MRITNEIYTTTLLRGRVVVPKALEYARSVLGINKFRDLRNMDIPEEVYQQLLLFKSDLSKRTYIKRRKKRTPSQGTSRQADKQTLSKIDTLTYKFISDFVENMYEGVLHGKLVPEWIHLGVDWDIIKVRLMHLPYHDFLKTYYWKVISIYVVYINGGHCARCPNERNLHTHHIHYDHHGIELFFLNDLEVLCSDCHKKEHGIVH